MERLTDPTMLRKRPTHVRRAGILGQLWGFNLFLAAVLASAYFGMPFLKTSVLEYENIKSAPFDGTVVPIAYVPNWTDATYSNKSLRFENVPTDAFVPLPAYDADLLRNDDAKNRLAVLERSTYVTPYMGSYRMNFEEYDGSHLGVDIRAPLGTPVLAIANGVVVRTNERETADGKYVVIRHDGAPSPDGGTAKLYSAYLHLESVSVEPGTKIRKGQPIGKVGMTGITTTPHLHFQIDRETAPFHAYWPYSTADVNALGLDFFGAVNVGLGKENAIRHTVHPMEFVQSHESPGAIQVAATTSTVTVASAAEAVPAKPEPKREDPVVAAVTTVPDLPSKVELPESPDELLSAPAEPVRREPVAAPAEPTPKPSSEIRTEAPVSVRGSLTRRDAAIILGEALKIAPDEFPTLPFADVLPSDDAAGFLSRLLERKIVGSSSAFRPNAAITRAEAAVLIVRASGLPLSSAPSRFRDVAASDSRLPALNAFSEALRLRKGVRLDPDAPITRSDFLRMLDVWRSKTGKLK